VQPAGLGGQASAPARVRTTASGRLRASAHERNALDQRLSRLLQCVEVIDSAGLFRCINQMQKVCSNSFTQPSMHHLFTNAHRRISGRGVSVFTQGSFPGVTMEKSHPTEMAAEIVSAFVSNNSVRRSELSALFETVHAAVKRLAEGGVVAPAVTEPPAREPAVSIRKSVTPDYLICLDDGRKFKSLRRHLGALGMTPNNIARNGICHTTIPWSRPITRRSDRSWRRRSASDNCARRLSTPRSRRRASANARPLARVRRRRRRRWPLSQSDPPSSTRATPNHRRPSAQGRYATFAMVVPLSLRLSISRRVCRLREFNAGQIDSESREILARRSLPQCVRALKCEHRSQLAQHRQASESAGLTMPQPVFDFVAGERNVPSRSHGVVMQEDALAALKGS
jgi:predicted transcriptional regulator